MNSVGAGTKWRIFCRDNENGRYAQSDPVASGTENIVLQLVSGEAISGTVTGSDGSPVANGYVMVTADGWMAYTMFAEGAFEVRGLPPGRYKLAAYSRTDSSQQKVGEVENVAAGRSDVRIQSTEK